MGEIQLKEGAQTPQQKPKQKKIWWRVLLAFFGGFLTFPLLVAGGAAIVGTVFTTRQVVEMAGGNPDDILGEKYQSQTILQSVMTLINNQKFDTLEDLNEISPMVSKTINETLAPILEENLHYTIDWDTLKTMKLSGEGEGTIGDYLKKDITEGIHLVDFIQGSEDLRGVLKYILYDVVKDEEGNPIEDADGNVSINENAPYSISDLMNGGAEFFNRIIDYIKIGDVIEVTSESPKILQVMGSWRLGKISEKMNTMKLGSLFSEEDLNNNALIKALGDLTVNDLTDADKLMDTLMSLKLSDVIKDIPEDTILYSFKDKQLSEIKDLDMNDIYLADLLKKEVYVLTPGKEADYNKVLGALIENERKDRFEKAVIEEGYIGTYEEWLAADPENAKYKASVSTLTNYDSIKNIKLEDIMENDGSNKVLSAIFSKGATVGNMSSIVNTLTLADVMEIEAGSLLDYDDIKNTPISESDTLIDKMKENVELSKVVDVDDDSPEILKTLTDYKGGGVFGENGAKIGNIGDKLDGLTLGQVIKIEDDASPILKALKDKFVFGDDPATNLTGAMNNLKFNQVFSWDDCKDSDIMSSLWTNNSDGDFVITEIGDAMNNVGLLDVLGDKIYDDVPTKRLEYTWWFLLTSETEYGVWDAATKAGRILPANAGARSYKISDFDKLVANMEFHMKNETLDSLAAASLINMDQATRDRTILVGLSMKRLGDFTLTEFIEYTTALIP